MVAGSLLDPLRPARLAGWGVSANYETGNLTFSKPMRQADVTEIIQGFQARRQRMAVISHAPESLWLPVAALAIRLGILLPLPAFGMLLFLPVTRRLRFS